MRELPQLWTSESLELPGGMVGLGRPWGHREKPPDQYWCLKFNYYAFILFHNNLLLASYMSGTLLGILGFKSK